MPDKKSSWPALLLVLPSLVFSSFTSLNYHCTFRYLPRFFPVDVTGFSEFFLPYIHSPIARVFLRVGAGSGAQTCWKHLRCSITLVWRVLVEGRALLPMGECVQKTEDLFGSSVRAEGMRS